MKFVLRSSLLSFVLLASAASFAQHLRAQIPVGTAPTGIAVNITTNRVYVSNIGSNTVSVIDGATNTVIKTIPVGNQPTTVVLYAPANLVYAFNSADNTLSIIDGNTNTVQNTLPTLFPFEAVAQLGQSKWMYITDLAANQVHIVDITTFKKLGDVPVTSPSAITIDSGSKLAYVTSANSSIAVIDTTTHQVVNTFSITNTKIGAISVDSGDKVLYAATSPVGSNNSSVSVLDATSGALLGTSTALGTVNDVRALLGTHKAGATGGKTIGQDVHSLIFISNVTRDVSGIVVDVGKGPSRIGWNPTTRVVYTDNVNSNDVAVVGN
jgi:YVTN family beta-propeller protein